MMYPCASEFPAGQPATQQANSDTGAGETQTIGEIEATVDLGSVNKWRVTKTRRGRTVKCSLSRRPPLVPLARHSRWPSARLHDSSARFARLRLLLLLGHGHFTNTPRALHEPINTGIRRYFYSDIITLIHGD